VRRFLLLLLLMLWPALLRASMQFRLANTSWRGLRFRFDGDLSGAYRAVLPLFVPGALALLALFMGGDAAQHGAAAALAPLSALAALLMFPWLLWRLKKYQHDHYAIGQIQTQLRAGPGSFYGLFLKTLGLTLLALVALWFGIGSLFEWLALPWIDHLLPGLPSWAGWLGLIASRQLLGQRGCHANS